MSKLKAYTPKELVMQGRHNEPIYIKLEADKVIADLDESHKMEVEQLLIEIAEMKKACNSKDDWCLHTLKENRHQKYKRCLAMANYWGLVSACTHGKIQLKCMRRELKWHKLADKFKEGK